MKTRLIAVGYENLFRRAVQETCAGSFVQDFASLGAIGAQETCAGKMYRISHPSCDAIGLTARANLARKLPQRENRMAVSKATSVGVHTSFSALIFPRPIVGSRGRA